MVVVFNAFYSQATTNPINVLKMGKKKTKQKKTINALVITLFIYFPAGVPLDLSLRAAE
jgi:hypothetical protein